MWKIPGQFLHHQDAPTTSKKNVAPASVPHLAAVMTGEQDGHRVPAIHSIAFHERNKSMMSKKGPRSFRLGHDSHLKCVSSSSCDPISSHTTKIALLPLCIHHKLTPNYCPCSSQAVSLCSGQANHNRLHQPWYNPKQRWPVSCYLPEALAMGLMFIFQLGRSPLTLSYDVSCGLTTPWPNPC